MPLYYFVCSGCGEPSRRILTPPEARKQTCTACRAPLKRDPQPPSTQVIESLDNGIMPRRIERLKDAETLYRDRAKDDPRLKKE